MKIAAAVVVMICWPMRVVSVEDAGCGAGQEAAAVVAVAGVRRTAAAGVAAAVARATATALTELAAATGALRKDGEQRGQAR